MDMRLLLTLLEAIECICTYEKGELDTFKKSDKSSSKGKKGKKCPGTNSTARVPKKVHLRSIATYARSMGAHIPRTTLVIVVGLRRTERRNQFTRRQERRI